jgi:diguanylate cyclase (GGDEF)-like protein
MVVLPQVRTCFQRLNASFFPTLLRKVEFTFYILFYFFISLILVLVPVSYRGIVAIAQSFTLFYLAFRFRYLGLFVALLLGANEIRQLGIQYYHTRGLDLIIGFAVKVFTLVAVVFIAILAYRQELHKKHLHMLSITDELTGLYNQRYFNAMMAKEITRVDREGGSVGLIMLDIDDFKMFNDLYGHDYGDLVLSGTGALLRSITHDDVIVCRRGGDEFAIILRNADIHTIEETAYKFKESIIKKGRNYYPPELRDRISFSMGLSEYPNLSSTKDELLSKADMALYHAKNLGKDKVHFYQNVIKYIRKSINADHQQLIGIFTALISTISAKDKYTLGHSERVSAFAVIIGEALNLPAKDISTLQYAGLLHDIGKIEIPKSVLNKIEPLTDDERESIRIHPISSEKILEPLEDLGQLTEYVRHHHERYDGNGYPDGLAGEAISLGARILCVADSFDAMLSERPYSKGMTQSEAFNELQRCAGKQFDPKIVQAFIEAMAKEKH